MTKKKATEKATKDKLRAESRAKLQARQRAAQLKRAKREKAMGTTYDPDVDHG